MQGYFAGRCFASGMRAPAAIRKSPRRPYRKPRFVRAARSGVPPVTGRRASRARAGSRPRHPVPSVKFPVICAAAAVSHASKSPRLQSGQSPIGYSRSSIPPVFGRKWDQKKDRRQDAETPCRRSLLRPGRDAQNRLGNPFMVRAGLTNRQRTLPANPPGRSFDATLTVLGTASGRGSGCPRNPSLTSISIAAAGP
jgi:hypothetical protein